MQKKILLLGGSHGQLPAIKEAKRRGLHTILCDYLPDNPGRALVDRYYEVSTTDKNAVLDIAKKHEVDAVLAYASDPAALTQAYVSNKLGVPGNTEESIFLLSNKKEFRRLQQENNFNTPAFQSFSEDQLSELENLSFNFPVVVKPVDASDSKGVYKVENIAELSEKAKIALSFSRAQKIIVEEYIDAETGNLHGDAFFADGEMVFCMLGDRLFYSYSNPLKPTLDIYPSRLSRQLLEQVEKEVAAIVKVSGYENGSVNIEARVDKVGKIFIMEIGPRSGGTLTPQTIKCSCGFDMTEATFNLLFDNHIKTFVGPNTPAISFVLHTNKAGTFESFKLQGALQAYLKEKHIYVQPGDEVVPYSEPGSTIGVLIFSFPDFESADKISKDLYEVVLSSVRLKEVVAEFGN